MTERQDIAFDEALRDQLATNLGDHDIREHALDGRRHAAIAIVVLDSDAEAHGEDNTEIDRASELAKLPGVDSADFTGRVDGTAGGAAILLTRRGARLSSHANQWAFPGGRIDEGETPLQGALRELSEEVGLDLGEDDLLGRLDDYTTRSGYVMSSFVFWLPGDTEPVANPDEVASIHRVGIKELLRTDSPRFVEIPESDRPVVQMPVGGDLIHAPTGAIMYQFREVAYNGECVRVDELEQPVFAWK